MDIVFFQSLLGLSVFLFLVPKRHQYILTLILTLGLIGVTSFWAIEAFLLDEIIIKNFFYEFWDVAPRLVIDHLSAFFILVINLTILTGVIYAKGYLKPYTESKTKTTFALHYFSFIWLHASMLQIVMIRSGLSFLMVWELMALSSFVLVIFDGEKKEVLKTGINYLIQMHLGFGFLLFGFLMLDNATGIMSFDTLGTYFSAHNNLLLFLIFFIGFGIKAGFMPLHSWLPHAHPAAPSHVSGIMSGVMIKMGIYGIMRVLMHVQHDFLEIGSVILFISIISGVLGVILAIYQHDLKKLLAYHSIENIGIIGIGLGVGVLGKYFDNPLLSLLGIGGSLLHVLNHSLFKSALFYTAGSVYQATHTRNIEQLGGLIKKMPNTAIIFLVSALAICGLPPFNGFISEFLIYSGVFNNLSHASFGSSIVSLVAIVSLALIGGLALFCFTKAFGVTFLGVQRTTNAFPIKEVAKSMTIPGFIIIGIITLIGFMPGPFFQLVTKIYSEFSYLDPEFANSLPMSETLSNIGLANLIFVLIGLALLTLRFWQQKSKPIQIGPTWGCGYTAGDYKHQYTSTSYADNLKELVDPFIGHKQTFEIIEKDEIFPKNRKFHTHTDDKIEENILLKPINYLLKLLPKASWAQTGKINHYLLYPVLFMIVISVLTLLNLI